MNFIDITKEGLEIPQGKEELIAERGFDISDSRKEKVILIMGLNPAGDESVANRERSTNRTYLFSIDTIAIDAEWLYNKYYKPIYTFANSIYKNDVKWPWCNKKDIKFLESEIQNDGQLRQYWRNIESWYYKDKDHKHTIYIGDMFYYHGTNSKDLPYKKNVSYKDYCEKMLQYHVSALNEKNKEIDFVYINNAKVSHWLCPDENKTYDTLKNGEMVFYGPMLSGMHAIDSFSRNRLINEIKAKL